MAEFGANRLTKVLLLDAEGEQLAAVEARSTQLPDDPFSSLYKRGIKEPPYDLAQLQLLMEQHPTHGSCVRQKAADIVGPGWGWKPRLKGEPGLDPEMPAEEATAASGAAAQQRSDLEAWFDSLAPQDGTTLIEVLTAAWCDFENLANAYIEVARDVTGVVRRLYPVPGHTIRVHRDKTRLIQRREGKTVWFKRWGAAGDYSSRTGQLIDPATSPDDVANELLVLQTPSSRSTFYGIPSWAAAIGWISLALAARDWNLLFFTNAREPRYVVFLIGIESTDEFETQLKQAMAVGLREPHRNLIIPVEGAGPGGSEGRIVIQKLTAEEPEAGFKKLLEICTDECLVAHRMPPERVGITRRGPLGGSVAEVTQQVYREAIVKPGHLIYRSRIGVFVDAEFRKWQWSQAHPGEALADMPRSGPKDIVPWQFTPIEVNLGQLMEDRVAARAGWLAGLLTLNEGRLLAGKGPSQVGADGIDYGAMYVWQLPQMADQKSLVKALMTVPEDRRPSDSAPALQDFIDLADVVDDLAEAVHKNGAS